MSHHGDQIPTYSLCLLFYSADKYRVNVSKILEELDPSIFEHGNQVIHDITIASVDRFLYALWAEDKAIARVWEMFCVLLIGRPRDLSWATDTRLLAVVFQVESVEAGPLPGGHEYAYVLSSSNARFVDNNS